ncbi:RICIN domain-containing protein [Streptomyces sp. NPDC048636]|uniref:RICIN domain-containing protein n=1 Tax=Streptomyces sp. NPDC048636 TaxID=3155762 RepID=UPI003446FD4D
MTTCRFCDDPSCSGTDECEGRSVFDPRTDPPPGPPVFLPSGSSRADPDAVAAAVAAFDQEGIPGASGAQGQRSGGAPDPGGRPTRGGGRVRIVAAVLVGATVTAAILFYPDEEPRHTASPTRAATAVPSLPRASVPTDAASPTSGRPSHSASPSATRSKKAGHHRATPPASKSPEATPSRAPGRAAYAYAYVGVRSGLCVDVPHQEGTQLRLAPCAASSGQKFLYTAAGELRVYDDTCVTATGQEGDLGAPVVITSCGGGDRQRWQLEGDGTIRQHGTCVDAFNGYNEPGTPLQTWECAASTNQQWERTRPTA